MNGWVAGVGWMGGGWMVAVDWRSDDDVGAKNIVDGSSGW
jgi:hypothetical protein